MNKKLLWIGCVLFILILSACTTTKKPSVIADGTYTGEGQGKGGIIVVELAIQNSKISGINIKEHSESPGYADAMTKMADEIISRNTLKVDLVSGATLSSTGFLRAVNDAFSKTGVSPDVLTQTSEK